MKYLVSLILLSVTYFTAGAQYAPQAGLAGSTAISGASGRFVGWATQCSVTRGYMNIAQPSLGYAASGTDINAVGSSDFSVVSLGDSGIAVLTFAAPIYNGDGADFAVFENGFLNPEKPEEAFLELAFVEVSSDGINYVRFPASSGTQTDIQVRIAGDFMNASQINNLAGKYIANYGTPFDLEELKDIPGLDINNITHVRIVDVIGSIGSHASLDKDGNIINDPYPTDVPIGGFDLDAVGIIHQVGVNSVASLPHGVDVSIYPNPAVEHVQIAIRNNDGHSLRATLTDVAGKIVYVATLVQQQNHISLAQYPGGIYYLQLQDTNGNRWVERLTKL